MFSNLVSLISKSLYQAPTQAVAPVQKNETTFTGGATRNIFLSGNSQASSYNYAKNKPLEGGYFAGYYNDKINIVGRKLFIEI